MKVQYLPSEDELILKIHPAEDPPDKELGPFKLWWDKKGNIRAIAITNYTDELNEFEKNLNLVRLGSIWRGIHITDKDIKEARETLLKRLEEKW